MSRIVTIGAKLCGRATRTVFDSAIHQYLQCLHETRRAQFALAWPGRVSEILVDSGGVGHGVHDARTDARRVVADIGPGAGAMIYARVEPRSDGSLRWEGRLLLARASAENRCDTLHARRPPQSAVARRRGRRQVDPDSARIGQAAAQVWRVLLSTAVEAEAPVIGRGERLQCGPGDRAERAADKDRGQCAAVVTEHEPKYGGNSPDCRTPP